MAPAVLFMKMAEKEHTPFATAETAQDYAQALWSAAVEEIRTSKWLRPLAFVLIVDPPDKPEGKYVGAFDITAYLSDSKTKDELASMLRDIAREKTVYGIGVAMETWSRKLGKDETHPHEPNSGHEDCKESIVALFELRGEDNVAFIADVTHEGDEGQETVTIGPVQTAQTRVAYANNMRTRFSGFFDPPIAKEDMN